MTDPASDPRHANRVFPVDSVGDYVANYADALRTALAAVDRTSLERAFALLEETLLAGNRLLVAGNGGSAAISDHLTCDWMKGTRAAGAPVLEVRSLVADTPLVTAIANDYGYDRIFAAQLEMIARAGDLCILISSSGNSPNIVAAVDKAHDLGVRVIGMTGFSGGKLAARADISLHVPVDNYGLAEDCHQALMHCFAQHLANRQDARGTA